MKNLVIKRDKTLFKANNIQINENQIIGLTGKNGGGKTTFLKTLCGIIKPYSGEIIAKHLKEDDLLIVNAISTNQIFEHLTGYNNLKYVGKHSKETNDSINEIVRDLELTEYIYKKASSYSKGMKQKLLLAMAFLQKSDLLILDEPFDGLDNKSEINIKRKILEISSKTTIIFSTHNIQDINEICDRWFYISNQILIESKIDKEEFKLITLEIGLDTKMINLREIADDFIVMNYRESINTNEVSIGCKYEELPKIINKLVYNNIKVYSVKEKKSFKDVTYEYT